MFILFEGEYNISVIACPSNCVTPREFLPAQCFNNNIEFASLSSNIETRAVLNISNGLIPINRKKHFENGIKTLTFYQYYMPLGLNLIP
jgi:hypothetical protein